MRRRGIFETCRQRADEAAGTAVYRHLGSGSGAAGKAAGKAAVYRQRREIEQRGEEGEYQCTVEAGGVVRGMNASRRGSVRRRRCLRACWFIAVAASSCRVDRSARIARPRVIGRVGRRVAGRGEGCSESIL
eukprot:972653-Prorocentrum_minimum.AAC.2